MLFFGKKILLLLLSMWIASSATFFLMHAVPGDPFVGEKAVPEEVLKALYVHFGLDQPLYVRYIQYFSHLLTGELGPSIVYPGRTAGQLISEALPVSLHLGLQALFLAVPLGISLGFWAALRQGRWQDRFAMVLSTIGICVPSFVFSGLLQLFFGMKLRLFPVALWGSFSHTILPTIALAAMPTAFIARIMRNTLIETLSQDYILTARAKGLPLPLVCLKHGVRNAILPVLSYLGPAASQIMTGSFVVEKVFAIPGLGYWMIHSIAARDYPIIMGLAIFYSAFLMTAVFLVDLIYFWLDPRIRHG